MPNISRERLAAIRDVAKAGLTPGCRGGYGHPQHCQCKGKNPLSQAALDLADELELWWRFGLLFSNAEQATNRRESVEFMENAREFAHRNGLLKHL
jgi:hypothetical protein